MLRYIFIFFILILKYSVSVGAEDYNTGLKPGFVYIDNIDPSIIVNLKYCLEDNLTGKPVVDRKEPRAVLSKEAALALSAVQEELSMRGYSLVIYSAYHPRSIYKRLKEWAKDPQENHQKDSYFPNLSKQELIQRGYIKNKKAHTRGSTVDVSIIPLNQKIKLPCKQKRSYKDYKDIIYHNDGTIDMGSSYDLMDELSSHDCRTIHVEAMNNRKMLKDVMENYGFTANDKVWWQYTLKREPFSDTEFDFEV